MDNMVIRSAEKEDVRQIAEILVEDWQKAYRGIMDDAFLDAMTVENRYEIELRRFEKLIVAADGDTVLGYAWPEEADEAPADCEVIALYVRYALRNRGVGKRLMQYAFDRFRAEGRKKMIVWCLKENHESRKFYENVGGKEFRTGSHNWGGKDYEMISYLYDLA